MSEKSIKAFPSHPESYLNDGMDLRDYFAAKAMHAIYMNPTFFHERTDSKVVCRAYSIADKMMKQRALSSESEETNTNNTKSEA
ncbi:hypothetical protein E0K83_03785 [Gramella sp. BOM4]|nr:hypothetical protein [Christiangramia bathymodioli]